MKPIVISASLVLYKPDMATVERTLRALQEAGRLARQQYPLQLGLTLVDNSSDDAVHGRIAGWLDSFKTSAPDWTLDLVRSPGNIGYGRGNNLVIAGVRSDYHIVVNPDLFVDADALVEAVRFMEDHADVGLLSPAVFGENGERHYLCKRSPTLLVMFLRSFSPQWLQKQLNFVIHEFEMRDCDYDNRFTRSSIQPAASCFFARSRCRRSAVSTRTFSCITRTRISAGVCWEWRASCMCPPCASSTNGLATLTVPCSPSWAPSGRAGSIGANGAGCSRASRRKNSGLLPVSRDAAARYAGAAGAGHGG
jgi:hypothetical protein